MLRMMTWNIRTGGRDRTGPDRRDLVCRVVTAQAPDVLAVQELRGFDRPGVLAGFADRVGMRPYLARSCFGQPVAVLVRPPWRTRHAGPVRRPLHHAAQRVELATTAGPLTVFSAHLDPYTGLRRRIEAGWLAGAVRRAPGELALLAGDLNTLDPGTDHTDRVARLPAAYRRRHLRRDGRTVDTRAVARLLAAGLVDLWTRTADPADAGGSAGAGLTAPTRHGGGVEFSGMRLDYLLGTRALAARLRDFQVVRGGDTEYASDHYPVVADLDLDPA
ncbi:endonuclease/exonuclease/phosphatase family protein [Micromonospora sp. S-DT3-3-22]|uniref:endonuclease/exonuclease/phosphatase family protein n=1 Tax=Micromonospora sp. S-DT3-3-22 TaxID=2755359 RepID=UPI00188E8E10|nr:endonuclease/exonuclease/phosphatase family protein [Micromonospora sp. S-DT3-3-22]